MSLVPNAWFTDRALGPASGHALGQPTQTGVQGSSLRLPLSLALPQELGSYTLNFRQPWRIQDLSLHRGIFREGTNLGAFQKVVRYHRDSEPLTFKPGLGTSKVAFLTPPSNPVFQGQLLGKGSLLRPLLRSPPAGS